MQNQIPEGASLEAIQNAVKLESLPSASVPNGALKSLEGLQGKVAGVELLPGEALLGARLVDPESLSAPGSVPVPAGMQEISVELAAERVIGGRLVAGDTVGIVMLFADGARPANAAPESGQMVFHKVLVTSVQRALPKATKSNVETDPAEKANTQLPTGSFIVTFARNDTDATKIAVGAEFGELWLTKEPETAKESTPVVIKKAELFR
ncbi:RcpC/CpaB family pilus assembly protein [Arthrobacter sp. NPDC057009]|uniref:RcpC/CpaB family pilus assembly protein n=1 Tax=Arthrobacter sp. NPDC057009 TaxID=3345996 RepID=UPI003639970D